MGALYDPVEGLAEALAGVRDHQHREQAFLKQAEQFGVTRFAYVSTAQPGHPLHVETNYSAEWVQRYLDRNYVSVDPVALESQRSRLPFLWRSTLKLPAYDRPVAHLVFNEAASFGLVNGLSVPIHSANGVSMMSMAVDDPGMLKPSASAQRQTLHLLAMHYHLACERALCQPVSAPSLPSPEAPRPPRLSPREREVLQWVAKGKTGWEIAQILNLTERTVVYHVENAKAKLGSSSRSHAVVVALNLGLIEP